MLNLRNNELYMFKHTRVSLLPLSTDSEERIVGWSKFPREIYVTDSFAPPFTSERKQCDCERFESRCLHHHHPRAVRETLQPLRARILSPLHHSGLGLMTRPQSFSPCLRLQPWTHLLRTCRCSPALWRRALSCRARSTRALR